MASPIVLHVLPLPRFSVDILDNDDDDSSSDEEEGSMMMDATENISSSSSLISSSLRRFNISKETYDDLPLINDGTGHPPGTTEGFISPTSEVNLPPAIRDIACVPDDATRFAYIHPPECLKGRIDWGGIQHKADSEQFQLDPVMHDDIEYYQDLTPFAIASFAMFGGFIYFDEHGQVLQLNAISRLKSNFQIHFSGPFRITQDVTRTLQLSNRFVWTSFALFQEAGIASTAWVCPNEIFRSNETFLEQQKPQQQNHDDDDGGVDGTSNNENPYGALVFLSDNGEAYAYTVENEQIAYKDGEMNVIADYLQYADGLFPRRSVQTDLGQRGMRLGRDEIKRRLADKNERLKLNSMTDFDWTPLHYACRFIPKDGDFIKALMKQYPMAVNQPDCHGRCPLHLALDENAPDEVIFALLRQTNNFVIHKQTNLMENLPLHVACYRDSSEGIMRALLNADKSGTTVLTKNAMGNLPLHLAIATKSEPSIIKMLLEADGKLCENVDGYDIYQVSMELLPLHQACWNNSPVETIELLLEKDILDISIDIPVSDGIDKFYNRFRTRKITRMESMKFHLENVKNLKNMLAIHIAMLSGSPDIIKILLQREREKVRRKGEKMTIARKDFLGRTPLHIACEQNLSPTIIKFILNMDRHGRLTQSVNANHCRPLHKACQQRGDANLETVRILLEAEDRFFSHLHATNKYSSARHRRSTKTLDDRNRSPLYLALKFNASEEIIEFMFHPSNFNLNSIDRNGIRSLAKIINGNKTLRGYVNDRLANRILFFALSMEFYTICLALFTFFWATERIFNGLDTDTQRKILYGCSAIFIFRELIQIKSQYFQYMFDLFSWVELLTIVLILLSTSRMANYEETDEFSTILSWTIFLLLISFVTFLRSTFLPFARFVGGLTEMITRLIPFFIVSAISLLAYAYSYRVFGEEECTSLVACYQFVLQGFFFGLDGRTDNALDVLFGIFATAILLNVVIAIVNEVWESATERATLLFWEYRLNKISEERSFFNFLSEYKNTVGIQWMFDSIDGIRFQHFSDGITWSRSPYNQVKRYEQYISPERWFVPEVAKKILAANSLQAELYWAKIEHARKKARENPNQIRGSFDKEPLSVTHIAPSQLQIVSRWLVKTLVYVIIIILGFATAGILQPERVRRGLLALRIRETTDDLDVTKKKRKKD